MLEDCYGAMCLLRSGNPIIRKRYFQSAFGAIKLSSRRCPKAVITGASMLMIAVHGKQMSAPV